LADDDRPRSDDQDGGYVGASGHGARVRSPGAAAPPGARVLKVSGWASSIGELARHVNPRQNRPGYSGLASAGSGLRLELIADDSP
jgi:hypothetical protein